MKEQIGPQGLQIIKDGETVTASEVVEIEGDPVFITGVGASEQEAVQELATSAADARDWQRQSDAEAERLARRNSTDPWGYAEPGELFNQD